MITFVVTLPTSTAAPTYHHLLTPRSLTLNQLLEAGFALEVSRFTDVPVGPGDQILYMDPRRSHVIVARAPLRLLAETSPQCRT